LSARVRAGGPVWERPVSIAGMAQGVNPDTPVALRYQVDWSARRAKFGAEAGEASRNSRVNTQLAGVRNRSHSRGQDMPVYSTPRP